MPQSFDRDRSLNPLIAKGNRTLPSMKERQLQAIFETALDAIAIADDRGHYLDVNPAACELFGLTRDELLGRCISEFAAPGFDFPTAGEEFLQQKILRGEFQLVRPDGKNRTVEYVMTANFLPHRHLSVMRDITRCKLAETRVEELTRQLARTQIQLRESGIEPASSSVSTEYDRLEQIASRIPGIIYQFQMLADGSFHFPYINGSIQEIYGVSREAAQQEPTYLFQYIHPEDIDRVERSIIDSAAHLTPWYCEFRLFFPDGRLVWLRGNSIPQREPDGSTVWHGCIMDITESKTAEIALRNSEEKFRSIIENLNDLVYIINSDGTFSYLSAQFKNVTGYEVTDWLNSSFVKLIHPEDLPISTDTIRRSFQGEKLRAIEYRVLHKDGNYYWHSSNVSALENESGQVVACLGIARYIHDRKQAEIALQESNSRWQLAIESAGDGTWDWNIKTNEVILSRQWKAMLGYAEDEVINALEEWDSRVHPEDKSKCYEDVAKCLQGETFAYHNEHRLRCKDGSYKWILARGRIAEWDKEGQPMRFLGTHCDISDRKQAEALLQESQKRYEILAEASPIGVFYTNKNAQSQYVNQRAAEIMGLTPAAALGTGWTQALHPEDCDRLFAEWEQSLKTNQQFNSEYRFLHPDGKVVWVIGQTIDVKNKQGEIEGFVGTIVDITDRKQAEIELANSQAELMALFNAIQDVIIMMDAEGRVLKVAPSSAPILYRPSTEVLGKTLHEIFPQDRADISLNAIREALITNSRVHLEYSLPIGDRSVCFDASVSPMSEDRVVWVARDITDSKRQEQSLRLIVEGTAAKTGADFFKSCVQYLAQVLEVRYALIAEVVDSEREIARTLAFWAGDDFADNFTYSLNGAPCRHSQTEFCLYRHSVQSLFPEDGDLVTLQVESYSGLPILDAAGNRLGFMAVMDTKPMEKAIETQSAILRIFATRTGAEMERMQAEAAVRRSSLQLRQQTEELETTLNKLQNTQTQLIQAEKMSSLGQLVAGIAHEINNPVSFIYGNIQPAADYASDLIELVRLYQEHYPNPPQAISDFRENIDFEYLASDFSQLLISMKTGATRISDIVKSLRTFSRLDEADLKEIDIHENIDCTLVILQNRLNGRAGQPEIKVTKNYAKLPLVECYGSLLNQVFMNLLVNAIDAIEQRQESLKPGEKSNYAGEIAIATSIAPENQVLISIQDNGCGMSPQVQEKIFNPFFTTKPVGKGTGMGLATTYQIITDNHRGNLDCLSAPGEGAEFAIFLPLSTK